MTAPISRDDFTRRLMDRGARFDIKQPSEALEATGLTNEQLEEIAGADQVIEGEEELGELYDQLHASPTAGAEPPPGDIDRATVLLSSVESSGEAPAVEGGARKRSVGIGLEGRRELPQPKLTKNEEYVFEKAFAKQGITEDDVREFAETGTISGGKIEALEKQAAAGNWTAVNSLTGLIKMRRAVLEDAKKSAATDEERQAIAAEDKSLQGWLYSIHTGATHAREATAKYLIQKADTMKGPEAQKLRDKGARMANAEGEYRAKIKGSGWNAGSAFRVAAQAQITTGQNQVAEMKANPGKPLPDNPPAVLGDGDGSKAGNQVPGAQKLLQRARETDPGAATNHEQLALEGQAHGTIAEFHNLHLKREGYYHRTGAPATNYIKQHRQAYFDARAGQLQAADARKDLYGDPAKLSGPELLEAERVEAECGQILGEFNAALGSSLGSDKAVTDAKARLEGAKEEQTSAENAEANAKKEVEKAEQNQKDVEDRCDAILGDSGKTAGEIGRDAIAVADAELGVRQARQVAFSAGDQVEAAKENVKQAEKDLQAAESIQKRDNEDAKMAQQALAKRGGGHKAPQSIEAAYRSTKADTDKSMNARVKMAERYQAITPPSELDDATRAQLAGARTDSARWLAQSAETDARISDTPPPDREARLERAGKLVDEADSIRQTVANGELKRELAADAIDARASVGEAWSDTHPGKARDHLKKCESTANKELASDPRMHDAAKDRIGSAAARSLLRREANKKEIIESGNHVPGAADEMFDIAKRSFDGRFLVNDEARAAKKIIDKFEENFAQVENILTASGKQVQNGHNVAAAQARAITQGDIAMAGSQVSSLISGAVWATTSIDHALGGGEVIDMKEMMAEAGTGRCGSAIEGTQKFTDDIVQGASDLSSGWKQAVKEGRRFDYLDSMYIAGNADFAARARREPNSIIGKAHKQAVGTLNGLVARSGVKDGNHWTFINHGIHGKGVNGDTENKTFIPVAKSFTGSVLGLAQARKVLGNENMGVVLAYQVDGMIQPQIDALKETQKGQWRAYVAIGGEVVVGAICTGGLGSVRAVAGAAQAGNVVRTSLQAGNAARITIIAINAGKTAGHVVAASAVLMGASYGMRKLFGANSTAARTFDTATNFIPATIAARSSGLANAASKSEAGARIIGAGMAGAQAVVSTVAVEHAAQSGWVKGELETAALGVAINVVLAGGMGAAAKAWKSKVKPALDQAGEKVFRARGGEGKASREQAQRDVTVAMAEGLEAEARAIEAVDPSSPRIAQMRGVAEAARRQLPSKFWTPEMHRDHLLATAHPSAKAELSKLSTAELAAIYPDQPVPTKFAKLGKIPGFGDFAKAHPAEARALADASTIWPGLPSYLNKQVKQHGPGVLVAEAAAVQAMMPVVRPHPSDSRYVVAERQPASPKDIPEVNIRPTRELDGSGAFVQHAKVPGKVYGDRHVPTHAIDFEVMKPGQLIDKNGQPLTSMDGVMVFSAHGWAGGFKGSSTKEAAKLAASEIVAARKRGRPINHVVLDSCSQRDARGLIAGRSNAEAFQKELRAELRRLGESDAVDVLAASRPGSVYGSYQKSYVAYPHRDQNGKIVVEKKTTPAQYRPADEGSKAYIPPEVLGTFAVVGGAGYVVYRAIDADREQQRRRRQQQQQQQPQPRSNQPR